MRSKPAEIDSYMESKEFCEIAHIKPQTAAKWRCEGNGPRFTKAGAKVLYSRRAVSEWFQRNTAGSTTELAAQTT